MIWFHNLIFYVFAVSKDIITYPFCRSKFGGTFGGSTLLWLELFLLASAGIRFVISQIHLFATQACFLSVET